VARRPVLSLVAAPARAKRAPFVALVLGILLAGLVGLLLLNTASAQDAFRLHRLQTSAANAADARQALSEQVNTLTGPAGLAMQAQRMGMVPMGAPEFWKPGTPLPPGARIVDGMVVVPAAGAKPTPAPTATKPAGGVSVTAVPRPGQKASTSTAPSTSTKPSTAGRASTKPSTTASTKPTAKATTNTPTSKATTTTRTTSTTTPTAGAHTGTGSSR
jgi:outer membrane biosynthesis protein TonB